MTAGLSGLVMDHTAICALAGDSQDMINVIGNAYDTSTTLLVPSTALATALLDVADVGELNNVLGALSVEVVLYDDLNRRRAYNIHVRMYGEDVAREHKLSVGHAAVCALDRSWPVLTAEPGLWSFAAKELSLLIVED